MEVCICLKTKFVKSATAMNPDPGVDEFKKANILLSYLMDDPYEYDLLHVNCFASMHLSICLLKCPF